MKQDYWWGIFSNKLTERILPAKIGLPMFDNVFFIPVFDKFILHAPLHGVTALVNEKAAQELAGGRTFAKGSPLYEINKELSVPAAAPPVREGPPEAFFLGLVTTRNCNLSCAYCGFGASAAPKSAMTLDQAVAAVDWMVENSLQAGKRELNIHFFGGEPFLAWDLVEVVVHKARWEAAKHGLVPHFETSTNGILPEKRARFVGDYFDVVVLSLDGFREYHDRNRAMTADRGSFEWVCETARIWSEMPAKLCLRTCVTADSVSHLEDIGRWYCEAFKPDTVNFDTLQTWPESMAAGLFPPDPYEFASHFVKARKAIRAYGVETVYAADYTPEPRHSFCPVGKDTIIVTPNGRLNNCYLLEKDWQVRGLDLNLGAINNNQELEINRDAVNRLRKHVTLKPSCESCFCKWSCAGGCHVNHSYPNAVLDADFCIQSRVITACSLLEELGELEMAESLAAGRPAMEALSTRINYCEQIPVC